MLPSGFVGAMVRDRGTNCNNLTMREKQLEESRGKKFGHHGTGKALDNDKRRQKAEAKNPKSKNTGVADSQVARSVLEQTSLDEFLSAADLGRQQFDGVRGNHHHTLDFSAQLVSEKPQTLSTADAETAAAARRVLVPIPHRPVWEEGMSSDELAGLEGEAFLQWRRSLANIEEGHGLIMTPYERNVDFWRQLWRCVEKADLIVQILDARDPEFYRCHDLERYVQEWEEKASLLLVNKADFLTLDQRRTWAAHFKAAGVDVIFFSALRELHKQQRLVPVAPADDAEDGDEKGEQAQGKVVTALPPHGPLEGDDDAEDPVLDTTQLMEQIISRLPKPDEDEEPDDGAWRGTVGFVGYPNVGKSSVINALFGAKKVSVSRTPGKTKHLQTLELPELGITLCDCPGLVFPSIVATKAHLVINGTVPLCELQDAEAPAKLVVEKVGLGLLLEKYAITKEHLKEAEGRLGEIGLGFEGVERDHSKVFIAALAMTRHHFVRYGVPDEGWGSRKILRSYVTGELLHCEMPPAGFSPPSRAKAAGDLPAVAAEGKASDDAASSSAEAIAKAAEVAPAAPAAEADGDSDFDDFDDFLDSRSGKKSEQTKRKGRQQNKKEFKSGARNAADILGDTA